MRQLYFSLLVLLASFASFGQESKPLLSPRAYAKNENVEISYGQPSKRGRVIFGELVPYGQVWRTGANEATEITFKKDCTFAGKHVKAGTYTLFTIPTQNEWTIILNTQLKQWGAFGYDAVKDKDILHASVPVKKMEQPQEKFVIAVTKNALEMSWEQTAVSVPMKF
ncbi:MAG: DUF2911 domain-containing protein [Bacteroidetes bacterium]|nr:DUF2911 domain-containing protein [Bacteroidota bacterium]